MVKLIQIGHSAFFKKKIDAINFKMVNAGSRIKKTKHTIQGKGYLVYK